MTGSAEPRAGAKHVLEPEAQPNLSRHDVALVRGTHESFEPFGRLVTDPQNCDIEIVRWPAGGWRPVDAGTGDEAGWVEGVFHGEWRGDVLHGRNEAVDGRYVLGWSTEPNAASTERRTVARDRVLLWHLNYHPDGGQLFFPLERSPFVFPVARPGDDITPQDVVAFWFDGSCGVYIRPEIWHEGVFPVADRQRFLDRQGRVHARVSCDFSREFGVYLSVPMSLEG